MRFLQNIGVRVIVSLIGGGILNNTIATSDPARYHMISDPGLTLLYAIIIFLLLSGIARGFGAKRGK